MGKKDDDREVRDEPFAMPAVPEKLGIDPLLLGLLHLTAVLDFADDSAIDATIANEALEQVELYLQRSSVEDLEVIQAQLEKIEEYGAEANWPEEILDFVREFLLNAGLGEDEDDDEDAQDDDE